MRRSTAIIGLLAALASPAALRADEPARTPLTADLLWQIKRLGNPAISPDGLWAVLPSRRGTSRTRKRRPTSGSCAPTAPPHGRSPRTRAARAARRGAPTASGSPSWRSAATTRTADLPAAHGGRRGATAHVAADGRLRPKWFPDSGRLAFISRVWTDLDTWDQQAARLKERRESKMTARTFDKAPIRYWTTGSTTARRTCSRWASTAASRKR